MATRPLAEQLAVQGFFADLAPPDRALIASCGQKRPFAAGDYLAREGDAADQLFWIESGELTIETHVPGRGAVALATLGAGEVAGWSWLLPPHRWTVDLRARVQSQVIALDGVCLRNQCTKDPRLGFELVRRFAGVMTERLRATRLQLLDLYAVPPVGKVGRHALHR